MEDNNMNNVNVNENTENQEQETKTYTAEEVARLVQAEADRRTNQALAKQKKEYEKKMSLSSLDEQQRKEAEAQMKIEELQAQIAQFQVEKQRSDLKDTLAARGLDAQFANLLNVTDDTEANQKLISDFDKLWKATVKSEVEKRLAGNSPKGSGGQSQPMTKEEFLKLPMHEMQRLMDSNREFYTNLLK